MITCRACALKTSDFTSIYSKRFNITLAEMLQTLVLVEIAKSNDRVLMVLCADCVGKTVNAYQFVQLVLSADRQWTSMHLACDSNAEQYENTAETLTIEIEEDGACDDAAELEKDDEDNAWMDEIEIKTPSEPDTPLASPSAPLKHGSYCPQLPNEDCSFSDSDVKCSLTLSSGEELETQHNRGSKKLEKRFACGQCGEWFAFRSILAVHQETHTTREGLEKHGAAIQRSHESKNTKKRFACGECGEAFAYRSILEVHQATHTDERNYMCEKCGATYKTMAGLVVHEATHREKAFPCTECNYRALNRSRLKSHMLRHSDIKPLTCQQCGKQFRTTSNLATHMRSHTGVKSFQCRYCEKRYVYVSDRAKHELTHTGHWPYGCNECGKKYSRPSLLKAHTCKMAKSSDAWKSVSRTVGISQY